jgi:hypothetical protein
MAPTSRNPGLTAPPEIAFFLAPTSALQRQYEALRAYFIGVLPAGLHESSRLIC